MRPGGHLVFDGQSLMVLPAGSAIPTQVLASLDPHSSGVPAVSSTTYTSRTSTAAARTDWHSGNGDPAVLIDLGGQGDLSTEAKTAAEIIALMEAYHDARRVAGFDLTVMCTVPDSTFYDAAAQTQRAALNDLIRASSHWDAVADLAADPLLSDATALTWFSDGVHLTPAGAAVAAEIVVPALAEVGIG